MRGAPDFSVADNIVKTALGNEAFTAACLLIGKGQKVLFRKAYGRLSLEENAGLCNEHTRFDMASVTKVLGVGMIALRALESGKLYLGDTLGAFIDAPKDKQNITIGQILTHTAGFHPSLRLWEMGKTPESCTELILAAPLISPPGAAAHYSCTGYILLGQLLECLYGMPLGELAQKEVFWPLKMKNTGFLPAGGNIAATEMQDDGRCLQGVVHDENARFLRGVSGNAGVFSTMDDMALFTQMLAAKGALPDGSRYLSPATLRLAMENHTPAMGEGRGLAFSLPWYDKGYIGDLFPRETVGHTGFTGTSFTLDPTAGLYVILLTNRVCPSRDSTELFRVRRVLHNAVYAAACE